MFVNDGRGLEDRNWRNWRSFFLQFDGFVKVKLSEQGYSRKLHVIAEDGKFNLNHLKIYKGQDLEVKDEEDSYRDILQQ